MSQVPGQAQPSGWLQIAQERRLASWLLWPLSLLYRALVALRRGLYARGLLQVHRMDVPVIVVGNVVVGGAGKTPCTIALVQHLRAQGWRPGVVSRGHGRASSGVVHVQAGTSAAEAGDEPLLIWQRTGVPVCVAARRVDAALALRATHPQVDILLCDDGLQHLSLGRQLAIAVFDDRGTGNGWLLPAGLLREPWPPRPGTPFRPDLLLFQRREGAPAPAQIPTAGLPSFQATRRLAVQALGPDGQRIGLDQLRGRAFTALAGIARPQVFFDMLREQGLTPATELALPDHADAEAYRTALSQARHPLICTEKDATKLFALLPADGSVEAWAVPLELTPDPAFFAAVDALLEPGKAAG